MPAFTKDPYATVVDDLSYSRYEDWDVADPAGQPIEVVRDIRDDIQARVTTPLRQILG